MNISKLRSGFHKPTKVHKTRRKEDYMDYNDSIEVYEDVQDKLDSAVILLRQVKEELESWFEFYGQAEYIDTNNTLINIRQFLEGI